MPVYLKYIFGEKFCQHTRLSSLSLRDAETNGPNEKSKYVCTTTICLYYTYTVYVGLIYSMRKTNYDEHF